MIDQMLRHGYTMAELHSMARHAVHQAGYFASDYLDRYETAWSAITQALYEALDPPSYPDLLRAGWSAIYAEVKAVGHHYGYQDRDIAHGLASAPRFLMFWWDFLGAVPSCETRVVERTALAQILPRLNPLHLQALVALAATDNYQDGATALGISVTAFKARIVEGRRRFRELWHEGEKPSRSWGVDRRCGARVGSRRPSGSVMTAFRRRAGN